MGANPTILLANIPIHQGVNVGMVSIDGGCVLGRGHEARGGG